MHEPSSENKLKVSGISSHSLDSIILTSAIRTGGLSVRLKAFPCFKLL